MERKEIESAILSTMADQAGTAIESVTLDQKPDDLGLDSLDVIEVVMNIEQEFNISINEEEITEEATLNSMVDLIMLEV